MPCKWGGVAAPDFPSGSERKWLCYLEIFGPDEVVWTLSKKGNGAEENF